MLTTPVLLLIFNRPELARKTFDQIRSVKPQQLFIAGDGPRSDKPEDRKKCEAARSIINLVDWDCTVKTFFREDNRGCGHGPAEAITWFFEHVDQGIILEDDCLAEISFFYFCQELLEKYKYDTRISAISGTNQLKRWKNKENSYFFSKLGGNWGWATWKREWIKFDFNASAWYTGEGEAKVKNVFKNIRMRNYFLTEFKNCFSSLKGDVWDMQWFFCRLINEGLSIVPVENLVSNIGFGSNATHTFNENDKMANINTRKLTFPLRHGKVKLDKIYDWCVFYKYIYNEKISISKKVLFKAIFFIKECGI